LGLGLAAQAVDAVQEEIFQMAGKRNRRKTKMTNSPANLAMTHAVVTQQSIKVTLTAPVKWSPQLLHAFVFHSIGGDAKELEPLPVNAISPTSGTTSELTFTFKEPLTEQHVVRVSFPSSKADSIEELANYHLPSPQQHLFRMVSGEAFAAPGAQSTSAAATGGGGGNGSIKKDLGITAESFEDAITYPFLTEEVGLPPAPITGAGGAGYGGGGSSSKFRRTQMPRLMGWPSLPSESPVRTEAWVRTPPRW